MQALRRFTQSQLLLKKILQASKVSCWTYEVLFILALNTTEQRRARLCIGIFEVGKRSIDVAQCVGLLSALVNELTLRFRVFEREIALKYFQLSAASTNLKIVSFHQTECWEFNNSLYFNKL